MSGQPQHTNEGLSNSVSSTPSSSVHPLELPPQDMMSGQIQQDSNIHVQGTSMVAPGDVSMDGSEGMFSFFPLLYIHFFGTYITIPIPIGSPSRKSTNYSLMSPDQMPISKAETNT